jgi:hypothetical protein
MLRVAGATFVALVAGQAACGGSTSSTFTDKPGGGDGGSSGGDGGCTGLGCDQDGTTGCQGLACNQASCEGGTPTTLTGTVLDPAGKVPIYNAVVYVTRAQDPQLADIPDGASCDRCDAQVTGDPIVLTTTDTSGKFTLANVPVADNLPLVIQIGKWRRVVHVPTVAACTSAAVDPSLTRLPRNKAEGHIPHMALTTGGADPLQCLLRKIGIDDAEFGVAGSDARIHLYAGGGFDSGGAKLASKALASGPTFPTAQTLWDSGANLAQYDAVLLACEGGENEVASATCPTCTAGALKSDAAKTALYTYAKAGGRVFASHYHEVWIHKNPDAAVAGVASFAVDMPPPALPSQPSTTAVNTDLSTAFPKAQAMSDWLGKQGALVSGKLPIYDARDDVGSVASSGLSWISVANPNNGGKTAVEYLSFNAPVGASDANVCGRVILSDIHVAAGQQAGVSDDPQAAFPTGCKTTDLSAQQKALEFMLFDLTSCAQVDNHPTVPPR